MRVVWADSARADFDRAMATTAEHSAKGAKRIGDRILRAVSLLERFPEIAAASPHHRHLRQMVVPSTPYLVIYRLHDDRVEVRAVIHAKRRRRK